MIDVQGQSSRRVKILLLLLSVVQVLAFPDVFLWSAQGFCCSGGICPSSGVWSAVSVPMDHLRELLHVEVEELLSMAVSVWESV